MSLEIEKNFTVGNIKKKNENWSKTRIQSSATIITDHWGIQNYQKRFYNEAEERKPNPYHSFIKEHPNGRWFSVVNGSCLRRCDTRSNVI